MLSRYDVKGCQVGSDIITRFNYSSGLLFTGNNDYWIIYVKCESI